CGPAKTVFELAGQKRPDDKILQDFPDLLLAVSEPPLLVCSRGVFFQDAVFTSQPRTTEIISRHGAGDSGYDLVVGAERFRFSYNPEEMAQGLERCFRYYFREFLPHLGGVQSWRSTDVARRL